MKSGKLGANQSSVRSGSISPEDELKRRAEANGKDAEDFWARYVSMKGYLDNQYYDWIQSNCPGFTDHGRKHIEAVIRSAGALIGDSMDLLRDLDLFVILSSIIWHDIGMAIERSNHAEGSADLTNKIKDLGFPDPSIHRIVTEVVRAHSGNDGLQIPRSDVPCQTVHSDYLLNAIELAALVRFSDEISENRYRVSQEMLPKMAKEHQIYWQYANSISASVPDLTKSTIRVVFEIQSDKLIKSYPCPKEYKNRVGGADEISLFEYIILRLEKMNNERMYCSNQFRRLIPIRQIDARFEILNGTERLNNYFLETTISDAGLSMRSYPSVPIFNEFFNMNPKWRSTEIQKVIQGET